jgi:hypothetical protein
MIPNVVKSKVVILTWTTKPSRFLHQGFDEKPGRYKIR